MINASTIPPRNQQVELRFTWTEFSGGLGDLGLFLPLVVGLVVACDMDIGIVLIFAGLANIITGWLFRQPIAVQPMKVIAAVAISEGMLKGELVSSGLLLGLALLVLVLTGAVERIHSLIPRVLVRGIQLGVGLKLAFWGVRQIGALPLLEWNGVLTAMVVAAVLIFYSSGRLPVLLVMFLAGFLLLYLEQPAVFHDLRFALPHWQFYWPVGGEWYGGLHKGVLPQLPLTLINSVVAICALSADYFPQRGLAPKRVAVSVALMNLLCTPLGGMPMCHGAGGLAAQYRFGARTGGSVIMLGVLKVLAGVLFGGALLVLLTSYPAAILGPMLALAGLELARAARDVTRLNEIVVVAIMAAGIVGYSTLIGLAAGVVAALLLRVEMLKTRRAK
jgi:MFS superfamily sulfate permease-like transporter